MKTSRRNVLMGGAAALAAPMLLKASDALASSGEVNVFAWGDYVQKNMIDKFENATGIKINLSTFGGNDEAENRLRAAGGKGFDIIFPSITNGTNYYSDGLLAPLDESKLNLDNIIPSLLRDSINLGGTYRGKRYLLPFDWGTEAITFDSTVWTMPESELSYGTMFTPEAKGSALFRQKSVLIGVGLFLDATGALPSNRMHDVYDTEEKANRIFGEITKYILERKANIAGFWNNATEATSGFTDAGATIGQTWDTTGLLLNRQDPKWKYRAPKEGAMTWMDSVGIPSGAENVEQAYAFINAMLDAEMGGTFAANTGYNSAMVGAAAYAGAEYKAQFDDVYTEEVVSNLWWYPVDTPWYGATRQKYVDIITNA